MTTAGLPNTAEASSTSRIFELALLILVTLCVFGCYAFPESIVVRFQLSLPTYSNRLPYVAPLLLILLWLVVSYRSPERNVNIRISWLEAFFVLNVAVWIAIEVWKSLDSNSSQIFELILPQIWFFLFYYAFRECADRYDFTHELSWLFLLAPLCFCIMQLLMYLHIVPGESVPLELILKGNRPDGPYLNYSSYTALIGIWIVLFADGGQYGRVWRGVVPSLLFVLFTAMIIFNQTRGALLIEGIFIALKLYFFLGKWPRRMVWILGAGAGTGIVLYLLEHYHLPTAIESIADDSARQRLEAIIFAPRELFGNYLFGIGAARSLEINFDGLQSHTHFVRVLLAYGVVGFLAFLLVILSMFYPKRGRPSVLALTGLFLLLGVMLFEGDLHWWIAVIPAMVSMSANRQHDAGETRSVSI